MVTYLTLAYSQIYAVVHFKYTTQVIFCAFLKYTHKYTLSYNKLFAQCRGMSKCLFLSVKWEHDYSSAILLGYALPYIKCIRLRCTVIAEIIRCHPIDLAATACAWSQGSLSLSRITPICLCFCCYFIFCCMFIISTTSDDRPHDLCCMAISKSTPLYIRWGP